MTDETDELLNAITGLVPPILTALEALSFVGRHLHPPNIASLVDAVSAAPGPVQTGLAAFQAADWPEHLVPFSEQLIKVAGHVDNAYSGLAEAGTDEKGVFKAYRALGQYTRAIEALYPVALMLPPVSRFFVDHPQRDDEALRERIANADASRDNIGIIHAGNEKDTRGGFSLYVPEYYDETRAYPLIMAMHGGSGHGRDFLWTWLTTARSRGAIVVSPTSAEGTWSLMGPDVDSANIDGMLAHVSGHWNVDSSKLLLTGMSDGGTFSYISGLRGESPFTHLAPSSASFHPMLLDGYPAERLDGLPIYLMHGVLDWMFPVDVARAANEALSAAGASVVYREIDDLSHTYPRDENPRIMDWFLDEPQEAEPEA
jgi:phospholipase/carboxylesterase